MKKYVRKKDLNSTNNTGVLPLLHPCAHTSGIIIYSDGRTNGKMNSKTKLPKIASWPGILDSDKGTRTKVVLARKIGKQGLGSTIGPVALLPSESPWEPFSDFGSPKGPHYFHIRLKKREKSEQPLSIKF